VAEHEALLNLLSDGRDFDAVQAATRQHRLNSLQALHAHEAPAVSQNELSVGQVLRSLP
jgi:DNA-binding GntR family transcriptional regulator